MAERKKKVKIAKKVEQKRVIEKQIEQFGQEVGALGECFGKRAEEKGEEWNSWFHRTLGAVGPLVSSVFGLLILSLAILALGFMGRAVGSGFIINIKDFLLTNLGMFFLIFLFFSYASYASRAKPRAYKPLSPVVTAIGIVVCLWIVVQAIFIAGLQGLPVFSWFTSVFQGSMHWVFLFFLLLGYLVFLVKNQGDHVKEGRVMVKKVKAAATESVRRPSVVRRVYRSSKDKILGGVCGGIAEYLGVDPVIIRLLWVLAGLAWGSGILLYIIAWIIIPRNPRHKWDS